MTTPKLDVSAWETLFAAAADPRIPDGERLDALRLIRTPHIGPIAWRGLIARCGGASAAVKAAPDMAQRGGRKARLTIAAKAQAEEELDGLARCGGRMLLLGDPDYPPALAAIADAPPALSVIGDAGLLRRPAAALVGSRNASLNGINIARKLAADLAKAGAVVVSGLARGIDAAAHQGALDAGGGTVAVVAGGVDVVYPRENEDLQMAIGERGAVVAESPLAAEPTARAFPRRNRVISGLSQASVIVEAALRSGSLITARCAGE
ncbi:MAG: DNA-processing protein DprA, partial [Pseudomonadota bacterium]